MTGIDSLYVKIDKLIELVAGYTEIKELPFIIKACRVKPYGRKIQGKLQLHRLWFDEYGNSLNIVKNKRIKIVVDDPKIDKKKIIGTDLYEGLPIEKVSLISKLALIVAGKTKEGYRDNVVVAFLGIDGYLRTFVWRDGWKPCPSLLLKMPVLKTIAANTGIKYFAEIKRRDEVIEPCIKQQMWMSFWPPHNDFKLLMSELNVSALDFVVATVKETND